MRLVASFIMMFALSIAHTDPLLVGTTPFSPPFIMANDSNKHLSGFDADLLHEICRRIKAQCEFKPTKSYLGFFNDIQNGHIDLGIGGVTITPDRESRFLFTLPYMLSTTQFITKGESKIATLNDIPGKKIGVTKGTVFEKMATDRFGNYSNIKSYDTLPALLVALTNDEIDVVLIDGPSAVYWNADSNNDFKLIGRAMPLGLGYGIIANKGAVDLIAKINQALLAMEKDGTYLKIYNTYFFSADSH